MEDEIKRLALLLFSLVFLSSAAIDGVVSFGGLPTCGNEISPVDGGWYSVDGGILELEVGNNQLREAGTVIDGFKRCIR